MSPASAHPPLLDLDHLRRQTFGDAALERELLGLFEQQCARLTPLMSGGVPSAEAADAAHTLKGSARAVGAWRVAALAEEVETALRDGAGGRAAARLPVLRAAVQATGEAIAERRQAGVA
jgi:HPt (histidine-containing phosphotransfer) domain-containing protein